MKRAIILLVVLLAMLAPSTLSVARLRGWTDEQCLATAIHYEARGENLAGKRAVLDVVHHRMAATGEGACSTVLKRGQFSWSKNKPLLKYNAAQRRLLGEVNEHPIVLINENYQYFYSGKKPSWARKMSCKRLSGHTFCKEENEK